MTYLSRAELDALKAGIDLVEYARHLGVELERVGNRYRGHCPFHVDTTPSFFVGRDSGLYYCFGCQKGGDVFNFAKEAYGLPFGDAVDRVREYAGGTTPVAALERRRLSKPKDARVLNSSEKSLLEGAVACYRDELSKNVEAQVYLNRRRITSHTIEAFGLGYGSGFLERRFPQEVDALRDLGLTSRRGGDVFYGRITVPIRDAGGDVVQLYGRTLNNHRKHRYLPLPHRTLFNCAALQQRRIVLCESILDALTFHSHGLPNAVSVYTAGGLRTAFARQLADAGVRQVDIAFDNDKAGNTGAAEAARFLRNFGLTPHRVCLPVGCDINDVAVNAPDPRRSLERLLRESHG